MNKKDALEILNKIKNDDEWIGYRYWSDKRDDSIKNIEKDKEKCSYFVKTPNIKSSINRKFIELNFHYDENNDNYIVRLYAAIDRDVPQESSPSDDIVA